MKNHLKIVEKKIVDKNNNIKFYEKGPIKMIKDCATCSHCSNGNNYFKLVCFKRESKLYLQDVTDAINACSFWESNYIIVKNRVIK